MSRELIWNSTVLVIIRESRQPLLNYRSHQHDWLRLGNCNTNLIIYRLYYYSDHFLGKVGVRCPHMYDRGAACHTGCSNLYKDTSFTYSAFKLLIGTFFTVLQDDLILNEGHNILGVVVFFRLLF